MSVEYQSNLNGPAPVGNAMQKTSERQKCYRTTPSPTPGGAALPFVFLSLSLQCRHGRLLLCGPVFRSAVAVPAFKIWDAAQEGALGLTRHEESISRTRFRDETKTSPPTMRTRDIVSAASLRLGTDISCMSVARQSHPMLVAHLEKTGVLLPVPTKVLPNLRKVILATTFVLPSHRIRGTETFERLTFHLALFLFVASCRRERCVVRFEGRYGRSVGQYRFKAMAKEGSESRHRIEKRSGIKKGHNTCGL